MESIIQTIESFNKKRFTGGISSESISRAENELKVKFSSEYKAVLCKYGSLLVKGEEILGTETNNNNVVEATIGARAESMSFPAEKYVISKCGIDGILLVQGVDGAVYAYKANCPLKKISSSLNEYLSTR